MSHTVPERTRTVQDQCQTVPDGSQTVPNGPGADPDGPGPVSDGPQRSRTGPKSPGSTRGLPRFKIYTVLNKTTQRQIATKKHIFKQINNNFQNNSIMTQKM